jgi:hypothetical protein
MQADTVGVSLFPNTHGMNDDPKENNTDTDQGANPGTDTEIDPNPAMESDAKGNASPLPRHEDPNPM